MPTVWKMLILAGKYWQKKRLILFLAVLEESLKMADKAKTTETGYDSTIASEGNGYKKQDKMDNIVVANGK